MFPNVVTGEAGFFKNLIEDSRNRKSMSIYTDALDEHEVRALLKAIADEVECPVCVTTLRPPVSLCVNGHVVCCECRPRLSRCPTCKEELLKESKVRTLDNVLRLLPRECSFDGCREVVRPGGDHVQWCGYRKGGCEFDCDWRGQGRSLLDHIREVHGSHRIGTERHEGFFAIRNNLSHNKFNAVISVSAHGQLFWILLNNNTEDKSFTVEIRLVPNGKIENSFLIQFEIGDNEVRSYTASVKLASKSWSSSKEKKQEILSLVSSKVQELIDSTYKLPFKYNIKL